MLQWSWGCRYLFEPDRGTSLALQMGKAAGWDLLLGHSCEEAHGLPRSKHWLLEALPLFFIPIWSSVVKPHRFPPWSPWHRCDWVCPEASCSAGELEGYLGLSSTGETIGQVSVNGALCWPGRGMIWWECNLFYPSNVVLLKSLWSGGLLQPYLGFWDFPSTISSMDSC